MEYIKTVFKGKSYTKGVRNKAMIRTPKKEAIDYIQLIKPMPEIDEYLLGRFNKRVANGKDKEKCWEWCSIGGAIVKGKKPYGLFSVNSVNYLAHRVAYFIEHKIDPKELHVLHRCDNHKCVNPNHLFLGTNEDNIKDKMNKGRQPKNLPWNTNKELNRLWDNPQCNFSKEDAFLAKSLYENEGYSIAKITKMFRSSEDAVSKALKALGCTIKKGFVVLSLDQVNEIREKRKPVYGNIMMLSREYNVSRQTINHIINKKTWQNI